MSIISSLQLCSIDVEQVYDHELPWPLYNAWFTSEISDKVCLKYTGKKKKENDIWKKKGQNYTENSTLKFVCLFVVATRKCWKSTLTNRVQLNNTRRVSHRLRIPKKHGNIILQSKLFNTQLITHFPLRRNCLKFHDLRFETKLQITYHIKRSCL